ncbi:MAG: DMT family transporter [Patescibacteria group bacterium]|nr:DMT family transporter [Patescibacteria group bacterium]
MPSLLSKSHNMLYDFSKTVQTKTMQKILSKSHNRAILALIVANSIWGAASPIFKLALENIPPFTLAFFRFFGAMAIIFPFAVNDFWIRKKDWPNLIFLSLCGITVNITFFFWGLQEAPAINAPIIASSGPVFIYLFAVLFLKEKLHPKVLSGIMVGLTGVLAIVLQPVFTHEPDGRILGNIFFVIATLGTVGYVISSKKIVKYYNAATLTFWSFLIGSLTFLPMFIWEMRNLHPFYTIDYRGWIGLAFGIFLSSALAYFLYEWSIKSLLAQDVGIFTYIDPVVAAIIAVPLLGEVITPIYLLGSFLVFAGIYVAGGRLHWHPIHWLKR